jgi:hypothetical protein
MLFNSPRRVRPVSYDTAYCEATYFCGGETRATIAIGPILTDWAGASKDVADY